MNTARAEVAKLASITAIGLPGRLFAGIAPRVLAGWRARVTVEAPSHLRAHPDEIKFTLLAACLHCRQTEITDTLIDLLITIVHRINAHAEQKVVQAFISDYRRVTGKENILSGLIALTGALEFRSANTARTPVLQALELIKRYKAETTHNTQYYARGEQVPLDGVVPADLRELLYNTDKRGRPRILRSVYEYGVFQTLREKLRCKEIWVTGAGRWRNPDDDLPKDFEANRAENYQALRKPLDPATFIGELREEMETELATLNAALPALDWLQIKERKNGGAVILTPLEAAPEPRNLRRLKAAVKARWAPCRCWTCWTRPRCGPAA